MGYQGKFFHQKGGQALEEAVQGRGGVTALGMFQNWGCGSRGHGFEVALGVLGNGWTRSQRVFQPLGFSVEHDPPSPKNPGLMVKELSNLGYFPFLFFFA